jgi:trehalose 6-phosphate phosphatase
MEFFPPLPPGSQLVLPPLRRAALLLDLDGTLLDIAPTPDTVVVHDLLPATLGCLREALHDALAIVTGRPVAQVDALLPGGPYAIAAEHGAAIRHHPDDPLHRAVLPDVPGAWLTVAEQLAADHHGVLLERKLHGFVLHYRLAPFAQDVLRNTLERLLAGTDQGFELMPSLMAWEIRARGIDKGTAVAALMAEPPFTNRVPVFIGDDRTDLDAIRVCNAMGGAGLLVPEIFGDAAGVRSWLARAAGLEGK